MNRGRTRNDGRHSTPRGQGRGRSSRSDGSSAHSHRPAGVDGSSSNVSFGNKEEVSYLGRRSPLPESVGSRSKQFGGISASDYPYQQDCHLPGAKDTCSDVGKLKLVENSPEDFLSSAQPDLKIKDLNTWRTKRGQTLDAGVENSGSSHFDCSPALDNAFTLGGPPLVVGSGIKGMPSGKGSRCEQTPHKKTSDSGLSEISDAVPVGVPYDICPVKTGNFVMLKAPLHVQNRIKRNEAKSSVEEKNINVLRPGMILLKSYISFVDQVKIVKKCRDLGLGSGGFYEPGYRDGAKLHLKMMCLGKNWDPETCKYIDERPVDGAKPPLIPGEFCQLVKGAIQASHYFLREQCTMRNVEHVLPSMSPNICIVNFYTKSGRLGLHQDKDESAGSLSRGLPVVSFSIGDSAEFLYGDQRDADRAEKVILQSGDVIIFGGQSRHIFHGVRAIIPETASKSLLEETHLLPGRLNLTFREY